MAFEIIYGISLIICLIHVYKNNFPLRDVSVMDILYFITTALLPGINTFYAMCVAGNVIIDISSILCETLLKPRWFKK